MNVNVLIILFNVIYFLNNVIYLELIERVFDAKSRRSKLTMFSLISGLSGSIMLMLFGSMSALGYGLMLLVYLLTVFGFYNKQSTMTKVAVVLHLNLHTMAARAIVSSLTSIFTQESIYELSVNPVSFWLILIFTSMLVSLANLTMMRVIPRRYLRIIGQKTEPLILYIALLVMANLYMIYNGNVYIENIPYWGLPGHQLLVTFTWLGATYAGIFMLVGFDIIKENKEINERENLFKKVIENRSLVLIEINCTQDKVVRVLRNGKDEDTYGLSYSEYSLATLKLMAHPEDFEMFLQHESLTNMISKYSHGVNELSFEGRITWEGKLTWVRSHITVSKMHATDDIIAMLTITDDIHEAKIKELDLHHKTQIDPLVGAYNKKATELYIKAALLQQREGALFMIDLDNFKGINDNFGHAYGDDVLIEVHAKIKRLFRAEDIVGRVGGDEFIVFLRGETTLQEIEKKASEVCKSIHKVYSQGGVSIEISSSLGIAIAPQHGIRFEELYQNADSAMYRCKKHTKNGYQIFKE